jgi:hypothetical protein
VGTEGERTLPLPTMHNSTTTDHMVRLSSLEGYIQTDVCGVDYNARRFSSASLQTTPYV